MENSIDEHEKHSGRTHHSYHCTRRNTLQWVILCFVLAEEARYYAVSSYGQGLHVTRNRAALISFYTQPQYTCSPPQEIGWLYDPLRGCHGSRRLDTRSLPTASIGRNSMNDHADIIRGTGATQRRYLVHWCNSAKYLVASPHQIPSSGRLNVGQQDSHP